MHESKVGTYDVLIGSEGQKIEVMILEDSPTKMVAEIVETGQKIHLTKHVQ